MDNIQQFEMEDKVQEGSLFSKFLNSLNLRSIIVIKWQNLKDFGEEKVSYLKGWTRFFCFSCFWSMVIIIYTNWSGRRR